MLDSTKTHGATPGHSPWSTIGRPARTARDKILVTAAELFCRNGFEAIGVDTIALQSGASKSTLYKHFASKDKLIEAVLDAEGAAWRRWFYGELAKVEGGPRARLLAVFDVLEAWFSDPLYYGCPFLNAISEAACDDERPRALAQVHKSYLTTWLQSQAFELGRDPAELTRSMIVLIDGAIMAAHASRDAGFAATARGLAATFLDAA
ncbi:MAG: TetR/AcrR family transcriptional regulator [Roseicyclus sp.]